MPNTVNYPFGLGGVAASMAACCTHPLDLTKIRMQTQGAQRLSILHVLQTSVSECGIFRGLFTGISASIMRQMSYSLVRLGSYEAIKQKLSGDHRASTVKLLSAAALAGGLGGVSGNPADIILVRMTSDSTRPPEQRYNYKHALDGLVKLVKEEGLKGLTRGLTPNTTRAVLMNASQVGSYDYFKYSLLGKPVPFVGYQFQDNLVLHTVSSCAAGTVATTVCAPADIIRSRVMAHSGEEGMLQILRQSLRKEGPGFLLKGWTPAFMRLGPNTVLLFVFMEQLKQAWRAAYSS